MKKMRLGVVLLAALVVLSGCEKKPNTQDPYESYNRKVFNFNTTVDKTLVKPVALAYEYATPHFVRRGVTNFFNNLATPGDFVNDSLQGKWRFAMWGVTRFVVNSTLGIVGLFDVATKMDIPNYRNDFGKTLAYWTGDQQSTYTMLPFLGPSTFRDVLALPVDAVTNPLFYCQSDLVRYVAFTLDYVNFRTNLLPSDPLIYHAFDPYAAMRNAYLQNRNAAVAENATMTDYHPGMSVTSDYFDNPYKQAMRPPESDAEFTFELEGN